MSEQSDILFDVRDGIGRVTFNRPQARNAFTFPMYERVAEICQEANGDRAIKVLIFTGAGDKAFASGTDINQFRAFKAPEDAIEYEARNDRVLGVLEECRVPTIAAIAGACTGGGAAIAACCDLRIGTKEALQSAFNTPLRIRHRPRCVVGSFSLAAHPVVDVRRIRRDAHLAMAGDVDRV